MKDSLTETDRDKRFEQAETRTEQANARTQQADARTEQANTRTDEANVRTKEANTRTDQANTRTQSAEHSEQAMRASELSYRRLFESARDGILILNIDTGRIDDVNPFLVELLGFSHAEMVGKTVGELSPFKDILSNQAMLERLQKDGYIRYEDLPLETRDGRHIAVEFVSNVYQAGDAKVIQCNIRDITERKLSETASLESKRLLRSTLDALTSHIAIIDEQGTIIEVNAAWNRFARENNFMGSNYGVGDNYLKICDSVSERFSQEAPAVASGIRAIIAGQSDEFHLEYPCHSPQEKRWFLVRATCFDGDGPVRVVVAHENITERKQAEEELRWKTAFLEAQVDSSLDGILVVDDQGRKILQNQRMSDLWKIPPHIAENKDDSAQVKFVTSRTKNPQEFADRVVHLYSHPDEVGRDEIELVDGTTLDRYTSPVRSKAGKHYGRIWAFRDLTDRKKLEQQFRQSQKMESIGLLASGVAHDFNNILAVIQMQADLLKTEGSLTPEQQDSAKEIGDATQRAANLTRQLLMFSRRQTMQPAELDLSETINAMTNILRRTLGDHVEMQFKFSMQPLFIHADAGMIDQVLLNLAVNARDAMPDGGKIVIETSAVEFDEAAAAQSAQIRQGKFICLTVSDSGTGIAPENLSKVFDPFFTTKEVGKGTGLGLATVFGIVQEHKGWVNVYSEPGHGTTFRIYLPRLGRTSDQKFVAPAIQAIGGGNETILLVEDQPTLRNSVKTALSRLGYRVLEAGNGIEALEVWKKHHIKVGLAKKVFNQQEDEIHLLFTDMVMPGGISGKQLGERLLKEDPKLKIIYASGYAAEVAGKDFPLKQGVNFLTKPFEMHKLAQTIRQSLDTAALGN